METLVLQVRLAARRLLRSPLFTFTSLVTLAVGIGANTAIFSVVRGVLLKPLPFEEPERLVGMWHEAPGLGFDVLNQSPATYLTYREDGRFLEDVAIWDNTQVSVTGLEEPEQVDGLLVTDGFLPLLRVQPVVGRGFTAEDDSPGSPETVVLGWGYWQRAFEGDPDVVGRTLAVNGRPREVIGVLPRDFRFLRFDPAVLLPARFDPAEVFMGDFSYQAVGRLEPGATPEQVAADVERLAPVAVERYPGPVTLSMLEQAGFGAVVRPLKEDVVGDVRAVLWVLLGTVGMVLLIACANVANLFLVRAEGRVRDIALRTALGADRRHITSHFLVDSLLLALAGGLLGLGLAWGGVRLLLSMAPAQLPRLDEIALDPGVLGFTLAISVLAGLLFGLFPLLRYGRPELVPALKEGGRGGGAGRERHRARNALVVAQVAMALVLLVGSGLMVRSFQALRHVEPGFEAPEEVLTFRVGIPEAVMEEPEDAAAAFEQMLANVRALPGVASAGASYSVTMDSYDSNDAVHVEDFPTPEGQIPPIRRFKWVMPGYFETMGNPVLAGRDIQWTDLYERRPVVVVTEDFAREYWQEPRAALGKRVATIRIDDGELRWQEIVGVVGAIHDNGVDQPTVPTMFWPMVQEDMYREGLAVRRSMAFAVRATDPTTLDGLLPRVREAVWQVTSSVPLANVRTLGELLERSMARTSFTLVMLGIAGAVALLLGAVGIYGVISYAVSQRTREIGVRMALGAARGAVSRMVVGQGMVLAAVGVGLGLLVAWPLTRLMASLLFGVEPLDLPTYGIVAVGLSAVAALASWVPARRAASVDPAVTLREE